MKKKNVILSILLSTLVVVNGCNKNDNSSSNNHTNSISTSLNTTTSTSSDVNKELSTEAIDFINAVNNIVLDENAGIYIDEAFELFDLVLDWENPEVLEAYYKLVLLDELFNDYSRINNAAAAFIERVELIPYNLSLSDERLIIAAEDAYENLSIEAKEVLGVAQAYERLLEAREEFDSIYAQLIEDEKQAIIDAFLDIADNVPSVDIFTIDDYEYLETALVAYEALSDEIKEDPQVVEAYNILLAIQERYEELINNPSLGDEVAINAFLALVEALPEVSMVTLDDGASIFSAKEKYKELTITAKESVEVIEAYEKLQTVLKAFYIIYLESVDTGEIVEDEETVAIRELTSLVSFIPALEEITSEDGASIANAEIYYDDLEKDIQENEEIKKLYETIVTAREKLDTLLTAKITFSITGILSSTDTIPNIVLQSLNYSNVNALYGVSSTNSLRGKAAMFLYAYPSGSSTPVCKINVSETMYSNGFVISGGTIKGALEAQSLYDETLTGGKFSFGLAIEDRTGQYANSDLYSSTNQITYSFENQYNPDNGEVTLINNVDELLSIKNNLSGSYKLVNDIDLENMEWSNLGNFSGTLDGNGHTIYNMYSSNSEDATFGLFNEVTTGGVVKNLALEGTITESGSWAGSICVNNFGLISNCLIDLDISSNRGGHIGGIACNNQSSGKIENCLILSKINGGDWDGGIAVGQYGSVTETYVLKDNISNGFAVGNNGNAHLESLKTASELKEASLYENWNHQIWCIIDGYYPTLIQF